MAKHVKKKPIPRGVIAGSIATAAVAVIAVVCVVLTQTGVIASLAGLFRKPDLVESSSPASGGQQQRAGRLRTGAGSRAGIPASRHPVGRPP